MPDKPQTTKEVDILDRIDALSIGHAIFCLKAMYVARKISKKDIEATIDLACGLGISYDN